MAKRKMSDEARKAASDRMKAMHAAKKAAVNQPTPLSNPATPNQPTVVQKVGIDDKPLEEPIVSTEGKPTLNPGLNSGPQETIQSDEVELLRRQIQELQQNMQFMAQMRAPQDNIQINSRGSMVGTRTRYALDPENYPSPVERLAKEPRLERFGIKGGPINDYGYELYYHVDSVRYQTIDGYWQQEPKFTLELHRVVYDEETGERTNGRYVVCRLIMHEDPEAAMVIAREQGIPVDENNEAHFLNEMRYLRMRDWLMEAFLPPKPSQARKSKKEAVFGNRLVEFFEINSERPETIPFGELKNKA